MVLFYIQLVKSFLHGVSSNSEVQCADGCVG